MDGLKMKILTFMILGSKFVASAFVFDRNFTGVAYGPYTKNWEGDILPLWSTYSEDQIRCQLLLMSTRFTSFTTYNIGSQDAVTSKIPQIAARINLSSKKIILTMAQGVQGFTDGNRQLIELQDAYKVTLAANQIFQGTVWGLTMNWENGYSASEGQKIIQMISYIKRQPDFKNSSLKIGARTQNCEMAFEPSKYPHQVGSIKGIIENSDYIMCNFYPDYISSRKSVDDAVENVAQTYTKFTKLAKAANPNIEVIIGETGWPSEGIAFNGSPSTVKNMIDFWTKIAKRATDNYVRVFMFEAIDEPWESNRTNKNPNDPNGINGGEGHYGWWYQTNNNNSCQFTEKIQFM